MPGLFVVGIGPGIGLAVARRFARDGFTVGAVARTRETLDATVGRLEGVPTWSAVADATDEDGLRGALEGFVADHGVPDVVVYNAAIIQTDEVGDLTTAEHLDAWSVNVVGAITTAATLLPRMADQGGGTYVVTGGMATPDPALTSLSLGKAGVRALVELLDTRFGPSGVHVATVTVGGPVSPGSRWDPDEIAERYRRLHTQTRERAREAWDHDVHHGVDTPAAG